ncbi:MAG: ATP-binding cassette domain-containing protein, partial [Burkholderiaceae bacterium]
MSSPPESPEPVASIALRGVDKHFGRQQVLHGVGFSIGRGEIVGLLGPNGSGKTTTLRIIAGYLGADAGEVRIGGIDLRADALEARRQIGYLPERPPLYDTLTVKQYLEFVAGAKGLAPTARRPAIDHAVEACALGEVLGKPTGRLSKGFRQRVGLAQAILNRPEVLLLDEATSGLDPLQTIEARAVVRRCGEGRAVLFSSHLMQEVNALCSRVILLLDGRVLSDDLRVADDARPMTVEVVLAGLDEDGALALLGGVADVDRVEPVVGATDPLAHERAGMAAVRATDGHMRRGAGGALRFHCLARRGGDPRAAIAQAVVGQGTLLELRALEATLEESFVDAVA